MGFDGLPLKLGFDSHGFFGLWISSVVLLLKNVNYLFKVIFVHAS